MQKQKSQLSVTCMHGYKVYVASGSLKGLEGVVSEADDKHSIVGVLIDGLGYACVKIAKHCLTAK